MKKCSLFLFGLALMLCIQVGSAFAETPLNLQVNKLLGIGYSYGGTTKSGFDCSGFTMFVFDQFNIDLPHQSRAQAQQGEKVTKDNLRAGDLVFFETGGNGISHVGIYLGNGIFAHSANNTGVTKSKLSQSYYASRYVTARRVLSDAQYAKLTTDLEAKTETK